MAVIAIGRSVAMIHVNNVLTPKFIGTLPSHPGQPRGRTGRRRLNVGGGKLPHSLLSPAAYAGMSKPLDDYSFIGD